MSVTLTAIPRWIVLLFLPLALVTSCTIQKRLYNKGYAVEWKNKLTSSKSNGETTIPFVENEHPILSADTSVTDKATDLREKPIACIDSATENRSAPTRKESPHFKVPEKTVRHIVTKKSFQARKTVNPPNENTRQQGMDDLGLAFDLVTYSLYALVGTFLFIYLAGIISIIFFQYFFLILGVIAITFLSSFIGYIIYYLLEGVLFLLVYQISKIRYNRWKRRTGVTEYLE